MRSVRWCLDAGDPRCPGTGGSKHQREERAVIREKLAQLAEADPQREVFGADCHHYRLNPTVDAATLARAERAIGAPLPEEYRRFVTRVGDGGAGPYYGVIPLADALERIDRAFGCLDPLGRDCPLTADVDFGELTGAPDDWDEHVARLESDPEYVAHYDRLSQMYSRNPWIDGRLPVVDYGCGDWLFLVVRGPRRGTVWVDCVDGRTGLYCLEVDFATFYQRWLDDTLTRLRAGEFEPSNAYYSMLEYGANRRYRLI
jgi:SMI1 / KNR4 family (SUKH-1)